MLALLTGLMETLLTLLLEDSLQYFIVRLNLSYLIDRVTLTTMPPFNNKKCKLVRKFAASENSLCHSLLSLAQRKLVSLAYIIKLLQLASIAHWQTCLHCFICFSLPKCVY